jgi:heme/copper-type cytochrome/quinol oxidase subunit 1
MNLGQRVIIIISLGLALGAAGSFIVNLGEDGGWFAYAPLTEATYPPGIGLPSWARLVVWLVLITIWGLASVRLLRSPKRDDRTG